MAGDVDITNLPDFDTANDGEYGIDSDPLAETEGSIDKAIRETEEQLRKDEEVHTSAVLSLPSSLSFACTG
jgi:hypothetical protein